MSELVDAFLRYKGFIKERGSTNAVLMPNILSDTLYICWDETLKGKLRQEAKMYSNKMYYHYRKFNADFFAGFSEVQKDISIDAMDWFYDFVKNEIALFRLAVRNRLKGVKREHAEIISNMALCKFLASQANEMWGIMYKKRLGNSDVEDNLSKMYIASREMLNVYARKNTPVEYRKVDLADDQDIRSAMKRFEARVMEFIREWK